MCPFEFTSIEPDVEDNGVVPLEVALAVEGTYVSRLVVTDGDDDPANDAPDDEITVRLSYEGGPARHDPCGHPQIEMAVEVKTRDGGIDERATSWMPTYPLVPDPSYSPETGITLPSYARASVGLSKGSVWMGALVYDVPSGITLDGSLAIIVAHDNPATDRYSYFPGMPADCIGSDPSTLNPTPEHIVSFLNDLPPDAFPWQSPDLVPERVQFRVAAPGCDEFGIARVPIVTEVTVDGAPPIELAGELTLPHHVEDPEIASFILSSFFQGSPEPLPLPDKSSCVEGVAGLSVQGVRLPSDEAPFELIGATNAVDCVE